MPTAQHKTFCRRHLKQRREAAGLSRTQLGYHLDRTEQTIYLWEVGRTQPTPDMLGLIAQVLNCSIEDLFALPTNDGPVARNAGPSESRRDGARNGSG